MKSKIAHLFSKDINSAAYFYKLRTMCNDLPYVDYTGMKGNAYINEDYAEYLSRYQSAIATGTFYPVIKFFEIPSSGCLTSLQKKIMDVILDLRIMKIPYLLMKIIIKENLRSI